ncbi:MAG: hypothetical protein MUO33_08470, partial [Sedimentisphaerales bacterium]|nr:hypothetical protein [Sedimentisphaerales bacterium]
DLQIPKLIAIMGTIHCLHFSVSQAVFDYIVYDSVVGKFIGQRFFRTEKAPLARFILRAAAS